MAGPCKWFGEGCRTAHYMPTRPPGNVQPALPPPANGLIAPPPPLGYRTVTPHFPPRALPGV